jgi:putative transposase
MAENSKFRGKYRIASVRLPGWDYATAGAYFITICTHDRQHFLGEIQAGVMQRSTAGTIAETIWHQIPQHFPNCQLDAFVVMPNHIHGILGLMSPDDASQARLGQGGFSGSLNPMRSNHSVSKILRWYKGRCKFEIAKIDSTFAWQPRFHDHIIRHPTDLARIQRYIITNPAHWPQDCHYPRDKSSSS